MYNRYIRNDQGAYTRIPEEEPRQPQASPPPPGGPEPPHAGGDRPSAGERRLRTPRPAADSIRPTRMPRPRTTAAGTASPACSGGCWTSST